MLKVLESAVPVSCWSCSVAHNDTTLFCPHCSKIQPPTGGNYYSVFSLEPKLNIDLQALEKPLYPTATDYQRAQGNAAEAAGFRSGDLILSINGQKIESFSDIQAVVSVNADEALDFEVQRGGSVIHLTATPRS